MQFIDHLDHVPHDKKSYLTLGTFDGVHLGHQTIINHLVEQSRQDDTRSIVLTFEPHPQTVINPKRIPDIRILTTLDEKVSIFRSLGIDLLIVAPFDEKMASMTAEVFVQEILIKKIGFSRLIIGHDHVFGRNRSGNYQTLQTLAPYYHFTVDRMEPYKSHRVIINSTLIRNLLFEGKIEQANQYMGRAYQLTGIIRKGDGRGRRLGFPTANLNPVNKNKLIPMSGVYGTLVTVGNKTFRGVTNIGHRPTFYNYSVQSLIETHIIDFQEDLYDREITLRFITRLREELKFKTKEDLAHAISKDIEQFKNYPIDKIESF